MSTMHSGDFSAPIKALTLDDLPLCKLNSSQNNAMLTWCSRRIFSIGGVDLQFEPVFEVNSLAPATIWMQLDFAGSACVLALSAAWAAALIQQDGWTVDAMDDLSLDMWCRVRWAPHFPSGLILTQSGFKVESLGPMALEGMTQLAWIGRQAPVVVQAETVETKLGSAFPVTAQAYPHVQRMRSDVPETVNVIDDLPANDPFTQPTPFSSPLAGSGASIHPAKDVGMSSDTAAWVSRTLQDTVRTTLRTLAQRDLESLDAGRPIQITLDQGQLRGAQLTLQAKEGLLEVSVSTSHAQLRATFEAQQDVLAQGLLRDIGAVRWMGLQDTVQSLTTNSSNSESDSSSTTSQQNSQGQESGQQNQSRSPSPELEELPMPIKQADRSQVIADAQSLRAFLGL